MLQAGCAFKVECERSEAGYELIPGSDQLVLVEKFPVLFLKGSPLFRTP
jgi:hypothetical protein